jgi:hypothetical protein
MAVSRVPRPDVLVNLYRSCTGLSLIFCVRPSARFGTPPITDHTPISYRPHCRGDGESRRRAIDASAARATKQPTARGAIDGWRGNWPGYTFALWPDSSRSETSEEPHADFVRPQEQFCIR